jgi:hypothetical protein
MNTTKKYLCKKGADEDSVKVFYLKKKQVLS